jgi:hypothetical protein
MILAHTPKFATAPSSQMRIIHTQMFKKPQQLNSNDRVHNSTPELHNSSPSGRKVVSLQWELSGYDTKSLNVEHGGDKSNTTGTTSGVGTA